jgi:hypothetical protein
LCFILSGGTFGNYFRVQEEDKTLKILKFDIPRVQILASSLGFSTNELCSCLALGLALGFQIRRIGFRSPSTLDCDHTDKAE